MPTYRSSSHTCHSVRLSNGCGRRGMTYISKVSVQHLHIAVDNLERYQLVVGRANPANEEQRGVSPVNDLCVCETSRTAPCVSHPHVRHPSQSQEQCDRTQYCSPLYSKKLHIRVRRAKTSWVTSFTVLALTFGAMVVNHLARRTFPDDGF